MAPMVAVNDGGDLDFYHVGGLVRLTLDEIKGGVRKIRVCFEGIDYITGTYSVINPGTSSAYTSLLSGSHNYVDFVKTTDFDTQTVLNIPVPCGDYFDCPGVRVDMFDASDSCLGSFSYLQSWLSIGRAKGKQDNNLALTDLSNINPITRMGVSRETANCYIVTSPGKYIIPLYYGNAIVDARDNISTAAPAKGNQANYGVFVNAYDVTISSGNIKTDLENAGKTLNTSGGKLIWSTANASSSALVTVDDDIFVKNGVAFLSFEVPSSGFREGSALIGVLKDGSTDEYVWAWHIWITNGSVLATEAYTNYQSQAIDILNRPLGGVSSNTLVNVYYQYGMPFPLPPSDGSSSNVTAALYDENGTYTFNYDSGNTITTLGKALSKPYLPRWNNGFFNDATGTAQNFYNIWDATQASTSTDKTVVKTIYDPSPAGMAIPRYNAFTGFTTAGANVTSGALSNCNVVGSFANGWGFRTSSGAAGAFWRTSSHREFGTSLKSVTYTGDYWLACLANNTNGYLLHIAKPQVCPQNVSARYYGLSVRPALSEL